MENPHQRLPRHVSEEIRLKNNREKITQEKNNFKLKLRKLFENNKTPKTITQIELAEALGINTENLTEIKIKIKIKSAIQRLFSSATNPTEVVNLQYEFYLEDTKNSNI